MTDLTDLNARMSALEERMNTARAETETAFERLRADLAARDAESNTAFQQLRADNAARETRLVLTVIGAVGLGVAILGVLIGLPQ